MAGPSAQVDRAPFESTAVAGTTLRQRYLRAEEFLVGLIGVALLRLSAADGLTTGDRARLAGPLLQQLQAFLWQLDGLSFSQGWEVLDPRAGVRPLRRSPGRPGPPGRGVDIAAEMLAIAQPRVPTGRIVVGDLCALPLPTASMAGAVSGLALARVGDLAVAARELARVVRAGGRVVVSVPHPLVVAPAGLQGDPTRSWRPTPRLCPPAPPFGERLPGRVRQRGMGAAPLPRASDQPHGGGCAAARLRRHHPARPGGAACGAGVGPGTPPHADAMTARAGVGPCRSVCAAARPTRHRSSSTRPGTAWSHAQDPSDWSVEDRGRPPDEASSRSGRLIDRDVPAAAGVEGGPGPVAVAFP